jgi:UDP-N-acetylmuramate: L-alanyl-gamma-D-glutamyl-meso-diaminopimelate ligase
VKRRQEVRGKYQGAIVIDDFAHHPRAISLTIDAIQKTFPGKKLVSVFEPVSATARSDFFQKEFAESLSKSDQVIIAKNPLTTTVRDRKNLDCDQIIADIQAEKKDAYCADSLEKLRSKIDEWCDDNSVLLVLSNRTCIGLWESDFVKALD